MTEGLEYVGGILNMISRDNQPATQAIKQAREIVAIFHEDSGFSTLAKHAREGRLDDTVEFYIALQALSVSASEREVLEARVKILEKVSSDLAVSLCAYRERTKRIAFNIAKAADDALTSARTALNGAKT